MADDAELVRGVEAFELLLLELLEGGMVDQFVQRAHTVEDDLHVHREAQQHHVEGLEDGDNLAHGLERGGGSEREKML